jgi:hypothetical protein
MKAISSEENLFVTPVGLPPDRTCDASPQQQHSESTGKQGQGCGRIE